MLIRKILIYGVMAGGLALGGGPLQAGWQDLLNQVKTPAPPPQSGAAEPGRAEPGAGTAADSALSAAGGSLTDLLSRRTGTTPVQAEKGAGALLQLAKSRMQGEMFSKLTESVPEFKGLLATAPLLQQPSSSLGGLTGAVSSLAGGGTAGNLLGVVSAFQQQGMSPKMIQQFVPIVVDYVKAKSGALVAQSLSSALTGF